MSVRPASLLLFADTNVDFEWNPTIELPGATFPVDDATFSLVVHNALADGGLILSFSTAIDDESVSIAAQDTTAETVTLAFYKPRSAIAGLRGSYEAALTMSRATQPSINLAVGAVRFNPIPVP